MEFQETDLPMTPMIYKAFNIQRRHYQFEGKNNVENLDLKLAQLLNETTEGNEALICMALMRQLPQSCWNFVEDKFEQEIFDLKNEITTHAENKFSNIQHASENTKLFVLASHLFSIDAINKKTRKNHFSPDNADQFLIADISSFTNISERLMGATSSQTLEDKYQEKYKKLKSIHDDKVKAFKDLGIGMNDISENLPMFEDLQLPDNMHVDMAYSIISSDPRAKVQDIMIAIDVAEILHQENPEGAPGTIAAALIDISIPEIDDNDIHRFTDGIGETAANILLQNSVYDTSKNLIEASPEFKQIMLAYHISKLSTFETEAREAFETLKENITPQTKESLNKISDFLQKRLNIGLQKIAPLIGSTNAPYLEDLFADTTDGIMDFVEEMRDSGKTKDNSKKPDSPFPGENNGY